MAANPDWMAMYQRLGFSNEAATRLSVDQGMHTLEELRLLKDEEVESLCKVIRRPGGVVMNFGDDDDDAAIPNPGTPISLRAENNLKLACYWLRHQVRVSRMIVVTDITLDDIRAVRNLREEEEKHKDLTAPTLSKSDWPKNMETIQEYLRGCLGMTGIPLAYVIRDNEAVKTADDDPEIGYGTVQEEMIARAPIRDPVTNEFVKTFLSDRQKVWEKLSAITRDDVCWSYVKPAQRKRDGREAYRGLYGHYLGPNNVDNMANAAEHKLQTLSYVGEKKRFTFESYVRAHVDQYSIIESLTMYGHAGIDERSRVRHLLAGIKTTELDTIKSTIMASPQYRSDFSGCVTLFKDFIAQRKSSKDAGLEMNISATGTSKKHVRFSDEQGGSKKVEDRYYKYEEYAKLSKDQRSALAKLREARGHVPGKRDGAKRKRDGKTDAKGSENKTVAQLTTVIAALAARLDSNKETQKNDAESVTSDSSDEAPRKKQAGRNRDNKALTRQSAKKN